MENPVTVFAPFKLAAGKTETDLLEASDRFQRDFADGEPGIIRRELVRKNNGEYLDIVLFRSRDDALAVIGKEKESPACHAFFSVMALEAAADASHCIEFYQSLKTYGRNT